MKIPRSNGRKKTSDKRPALPEIWSGLVYADLLSKFTRAIEKLAIRDVRSVVELKNDSTKKSQSKAAFDAGRQMIKDLNIDNPDVIKAVRKIEGSAKAFEATHKSNIQQLGKLLPRAEDGAQMSWPPPVPAHLAINSFVSLSLRIHTERPNILARQVMIEAARTTILPVLAHWICISGPSGMPNTQALKVLEEAFTEKPGSRKGRTEDPWVRLASVLATAAKAAFGNEAHALMKEIRSLVADHKQNPHGGRLWQQMGKLNGTPPGSNLLTLFECIQRLEHTDSPTEAHARGASTLYCSRLRYEAVRLGHYDEDFKRIAAGDVKEINRATHDISKLHERDKLGMAFILSRLALISPGEQDESDRKSHLASLTIKLLKDVADGKSPGPKIKEVADRYLLGFMTNPRFAKPFNDITDVTERLEKYKARHNINADSIPALLAGVFEARLLWARALGGEKLAGGDTHVISLYAQACEKLLQSIEEGAHHPAFDSEAPVWILPEMSALVWMGNKYQDRSEILGRLGKQMRDAPEEEESELRKRFANASSILSRIAETEFGIYYHQVYERTRILEGMVIFSRIAEATRRR
jgi:hypothetical protein